MCVFTLGLEIPKIPLNVIFKLCTFFNRHGYEKVVAFRKFEVSYIRHILWLFLFYTFDFFLLPIFKNLREWITFSHTSNTYLVSFLFIFKPLPAAYHHLQISLLYFLNTTAKSMKGNRFCSMCSISHVPCYIFFEFISYRITENSYLSLIFF